MMCDDVRDLVSIGIDGAVIGCLDTNGDVDFDGCKKIVEAAFEGENVESSQILGVVCRRQKCH
jgi:copper homeostasis protein CutC